MIVGSSLFFIISQSFVKCIDTSLLHAALFIDKNDKIVKNEGFFASFPSPFLWPLFAGDDRGKSSQR